MPNEGATQFGAIKAVLTLDKSDYVRGLKEAGAQADELGRHDPTIRVETDGVPKAIAELKSAEAAADRYQRTATTAGHRTRGLVTALALVGPAVVPLGAATIALGTAFAGMGTAGVLALVGIKREMDEGTDTGLAFGAAVDDAKGSLDRLSRTAAGRFLRPFQDAVDDLDRSLPRLNAQVGDLASITGRAAASGFGGLIAAFQAFEPLIRDASMYVLDLTQRFEAAMSGPGVVAFGEYVRSTFPQIMAALENIVAAAAHLVAALAPLGLGTLSTLSAFASLIRAIPTDVLATLAQLAGSVFLGFKAWQGLSGLVDGLGAALGRVGIAGGKAATALRGLQIASGVIGVALAGLSLVMSAMSSNTQEAQARTDSLTDALIRSNGAIDEGVRLSALKAAQDDGAIRNAGLLGLSTNQVVDAYLGQAGALGDLEAARDRAMRKTFEEIQAGKDVGHSVGDVNTAYLELVNSLGAAGVRWGEAKVGLDQHREVLNGTATATSAATLETQRLAAMYGVSVPTYQAAVEAQKGIADKTAMATAQMILENNAAGLLRQSLELLNGGTLNLAAAQTSSASATLSAAAAIKESSGQLKLNSKEGVAARQAIESKARADQALAEATATATGSTKAGTKSLADSKAQLEKTLKSQGLLTDEVQAYINKLYQVPKKVPPTKLEVEKAEAEKRITDLKAHIASITGKTVTITTVMRYLEEVDRSTRTGRGRLEGNAAGGLVGLRGGGKIGDKIPGYAAGTIVGPGTGTSDSILARVRESGRLLLVSNGEFLSTAASTRQNRAALEAGNKGAELGVVGRRPGDDLQPVDLSRATIKALAHEIAQLQRSAAARGIRSWESGIVR